MRREVEGLAETHRDALARAGELRPDGHRLVGADEADRDHRCTGLQRQERHSRAALVEPAVEGARALGVERDGATVFEEHALLVEGVEGLLPAPRSTAIAPMAVKNCREAHFSKYADFAMKCTGRGAATGMAIESMNDRWLLAKITGPVRGTFSRPSTCGR